MVRLLISAVLILSAFMTVNACKWCQCLRNDGSHCCIYTDNTDCQTVCKLVHDSNGNLCGSTSSLNYKCATLGECNDRSHCRETHACLA
ncbi:hypothetical protein B0H12DRAFT_1025288 [Mycena haematopus]|nr:hypothetical protein B0H12DRAFT_1025288 [Mycena haematopus]